MTREEAKKEIEKVFVPAYANYIITALTERCNLKGITEEDFWERAGYDRALRDCGVLEDV